MNEITDAALDSWYRNIWIDTEGFDPYEGPYEETEEG